MRTVLLVLDVPDSVCYVFFYPNNNPLVVPGILPVLTRAPLQLYHLSGNDIPYAAFVHLLFITKPAPARLISVMPRR